MSIFTYKSFTSVILWITFILSIFIIFTTQNYFGGGDTFQHYSLAHWGWKYPYLLFDHWGKPVFTILASPFAQMGFKGMQFFNLVLGFGTALVLWKLGKVVGLKNNFLTPLFVLSIPIYVPLIFSALTEVSFSFFISLSILLFFKKRYILSAVMLSTIPLIRTESVVVLPLFMLAFLLKRKYLHILLFTTAFWIISFFGMPYYDNDFWWLFTHMPYSGSARDIYGSGTWYHFFYNTIDSYPITGKIAGLLFTIGLILLLVRWIKNDKFKNTTTFNLLLLVAGSYIVFFAAHSFVWWQGMGNSLGLQRVIGSVTPLAAFMGMIGLDFILNRISGINNNYKAILGYVIVATIFYTGIKDYRHKFRPSYPQQVMNGVADYIIENDLLTNKIYFFSQYVVFKLGIDPYDNEKCVKYLQNKHFPSMGLPDGSLIIWDAHFGANEGRINLESLENDSALYELKTFKPAVPFKVLGGHDYQVKIFKKDISRISNQYPVINYSFESNSPNTTTELSYTGNSSLKVTKSMEYLPGLISHMNETFIKPGMFEISVEGNFLVKDTSDIELFMVSDIRHDNNIVFYDYTNISNSITKTDAWINIKRSVVTPQFETPDLLANVFIWNKTKSEFYVDDVVYKIISANKPNELFSNMQINLKEDEFNFDDESKYVDLFDDNISFGTSNGRIKVEVSGYIKIQGDMVTNLPIVCSTFEKTKNPYYSAYNLAEINQDKNNWNYFNHVFYINNFADLSSRVKVYVWNKQLARFALSDVVIKIHPEDKK